jgi:hypothetical protein
MSPDLDAFLALLNKIERDVKPAPEPLVLDSEYLNLIARAEALPQNRDRTAKNGREDEYRLWREHYARARQVR